MRRPLVLAVSLLVFIGAGAAKAHAQPILRGIALVERGPGRAYVEDPRTGIVTAYALGDTVGGARIEQIQEDRVVLRRGLDTVQLLLGVHPEALSSGAGEADATPQPVGANVEVSAEPVKLPIIGNGQPWLDRLGIRRGALSRAIELAPPASESSDLDD